MVLRRCFIEIHQNLMAASVFLLFEENALAEKDVRVNISYDSMVLTSTDKKTIIDLHHYMRMDSSTMCNLTVDKDIMNFRLTLRHLENAFLTVPKKFLYQRAMLEFNIKENDNVTIHCSHCSKILIDNQCYRRTCYFPDDNCEPDDFFCHPDIEIEPKLLPKVDEIFYGFQFVVVNKEVINSNVNIINGNVFCHCSQLVGKTIFDETEIIKLWADMIYFQKDENKCEFFEPLDSPLPTMMLKKMWTESINVYCHPSIKLELEQFLIEATFPNHDTKYLLIKLCEKQLLILDGPSTDEGLENPYKRKVKDVDTKYLKNKGCYRIFYDVKTKPHSTEIPPIVIEWKEDGRCVKLEVSYKRFDELLAEIKEGENLLPKQYRQEMENFKKSYYVF